MATAVHNMLRTSRCAVFIFSLSWLLGGKVERVNLCKEIQTMGSSQFPFRFTARNTCRRSRDPVSISTSGRSFGQQTEKGAGNAAGGAIFLTCSNLTMFIFKCQQTLRKSNSAALGECTLHSPRYQPWSLVSPTDRKLFEKGQIFLKG